MNQVILNRQPSTSEGTFGSLSTDNFNCCTLELPWLNDLPDVSCIPPGSYTCNWRFSPSHNRNIYHVDGVEGRTAVEIHSGNTIYDIKGCLLLGAEIVTFPALSFPNVNIPMKGIQHSKLTLQSFETLMNQQPFELIIN
jgi:Family of unknown function (DUF5675)